MTENQPIPIADAFTNNLEAIDPKFEYVIHIPGSSRWELEDTNEKWIEPGKNEDIIVKKENKTSLINVNNQRNPIQSRFTFVDNKFKYINKLPILINHRFAGFHTETLLFDPANITIKMSDQSKHNIAMQETRDAIYHRPVSGKHYQQVKEEYGHAFKQPEQKAGRKKSFHKKRRYTRKTRARRY